MAVTIAPVVDKEMPLDIAVIGSAEAYSSVAVHAQITGELTSVNFQQGDDVSAGQVLVELAELLHRALDRALAGHLGADRPIGERLGARPRVRRGPGVAHQVDDPKNALATSSSRAVRWKAPRQ